MADFEPLAKKRQIEELSPRELVDKLKSDYTRLNIDYDRLKENMNMVIENRKIGGELKEAITRWVSDNDNRRSKINAEIPHLLKTLSNDNIKKLNRHITKLNTLNQKLIGLIPTQNIWRFIDSRYVSNVIGNHFIKPNEAVDGNADENIESNKLSEFFLYSKKTPTNDIIKIQRDNGELSEFMKLNNYGIVITGHSIKPSIGNIGGWYINLKIINPLTDPAPIKVQLERELKTIQQIYETQQKMIELRQLLTNMNSNKDDVKRQLEEYDQKIQECNDILIENTDFKNLLIYKRYHGHDTDYIYKLEKKQEELYKKNETYKSLKDISDAYNKLYNIYKLIKTQIVEINKDISANPNRNVPDHRLIQDTELNRRNIEELVIKIDRVSIKNIPSTLLDPADVRPLDMNNLHLSIHFNAQNVGYASVNGIRYGYGEQPVDQAHITSNDIKFNLEFMRIGRNIIISNKDNIISFVEHNGAHGLSSPKSEHIQKLKEAFNNLLIGCEKYFSYFINEDYPIIENPELGLISIPPVAIVNNLEYNKYLKYKVKYIELKNLLSKMSIK